MLCRKGLPVNICKPDWKIRNKNKTNQTLYLINFFLCSCEQPHHQCVAAHKRPLWHTPCRLEGRKASPRSHFRKLNLIPAKLTSDKLEQSFESNSVPCTLYGKQPQKSLLLQEANLPLLLQNNGQA